MKFIGFVIALAVVAQPARAQLTKPVIDKSPSGIPRVMSPGPTAWRDTLGWKLVLDHVVQPADGTSGELGNPRSVALYVDGRIAVQEEEPAEIKLFDAKGKFLHTIGRQGAGPGEFQVPTIFATGTRLVVHDSKLARVTLFTLDGKLIRSFPGTCCNGGPLPFLDARSRISAPAFGAGKGGKGRAYYMVFDTLGRKVDSLDFPSAMEAKEWKVPVTGGMMTFGVPLAPVNRHLLLPDGTLIFGRTDRYELLVSHAGRDTTRIFGRRGMKGFPIPGNYRDSIFHARTDRLQGDKSKVSESDMPSVFDLWNDLARDGSGNIWVHSGGGHRGPARFDVFAPAGTFLGSVPAPWTFGLATSWVGDRVAVIDEDTDGLPRVRVFRIVRQVGR